MHLPTEGQGRNHHRRTTHCLRRLSIPSDRRLQAARTHHCLVLRDHPRRNGVSCWRVDAIAALTRPFSRASVKWRKEQHLPTSQREGRNEHSEKCAAERRRCAWSSDHINFFPIPHAVLLHVSRLSHLACAAVCPLTVADLIRFLYNGGLPSEMWPGCNLLTPIRRLSPIPLRSLRTMSSKRRARMRVCRRS